MLKRKNKNASLAVIFVTVFIDLMGFGILIPILPTFASSEIGISDFGIGVIVASYSFIQFLFNPIFGKVSDRIGRRPVIILSLFFTGISYIIFSFSTTFLVLILSRMLAGFGGSNVGTAQAYIADITEPSQRSSGMGLIGAAFGLGFVFGPIIGGFLSEYGYPMVGFVSAGFSFLSMIFAFFFLPESLKLKVKKEKISYKLFELNSLKETFQLRYVGLFMLLFFIIIFSMANIYGTFALLGVKFYHFTDKQIGLLFGIVGFVGVVVQGGLIKILSKKFDDKTLLFAGITFMMFGLAFIPYGINFTGVAIVTTVLAIGTGLLQPTIPSLISKYSPEDKQGSILGINQSLSALARVLGPLWGGFAFEYLGYEFPFLTGGIFTFITLLIALYYLNSRKLKRV